MQTVNESIKSVLQYNKSTAGRVLNEENLISTRKNELKKIVEEQTESISEAKDDGALKYVKKVDGKYALVSTHTGKNLKFWDHKPNQEEADKALRAVEFFKHSK